MAWGPWPGPATVHYKVASQSGRDLDIFIFEENAYQWYVEDQQRDVPFNTGYQPVKSMLQTQNAEDWVPLAEGKRYYLVVDNTPVGSANGNGDGTYDTLYFTWYIEGVSDELQADPINTNVAAKASSVMAVLFAAVAALVVRSL